MAKKALKRNILVSGTSKNTFGFTFIELVVVIMIIALVATIAIPNLQQRMPGYQRKQFFTELNSLMTIAWEHALSTNTLHRVLFDFDRRTIKIELEIKDHEKEKAKFKEITGAYRKTMYQWPETIEVRQFFIEGVNEMRSGTKVDKMWIFITPEGLAQDVVINAVDINQHAEIPLGFVLNPFTAQFTSYETFQKP